MVSDSDLGELLSNVHTIAVVGLSNNVDRPSYAVASYLQRNDYTIVPVNPALDGPVLGEQPFARLSDIPLHIDMVVVFRQAQYAADIVDEAAANDIDTVWLQLGIVSDEAAVRAIRHGVTLVMDRCVAVEHRRLSRYAAALV